MTQRTPPGRPAEPLALPVFARLAPALPPEVLAARIDAGSVADDLVVDPFGRGGWVARTALAMGRRALSIEVTPLTRLLADVVVRAPDLRHLDAAFQAVAAAPVGATSLRAAIDERFATRCPTCGRTIPLDELTWEPDDAGVVRPVRRSFRCPACLDRRGRGGELRHAGPEADDLDRASSGPVDPAVRADVERRFPLEPDGADGLLDELLGLHSPRQLEGLAAILARVEGELRASQVTSALRLALLHAVLPASRLLGPGGRVGSLRIADARVRPAGAAWRERNPWRAFEEGYQLVRAFVQALDDGPYGAVQARLAEPIDALLEGPPMISLRVGGEDAFERLAAEAEALGAAGRARVRLVVAQGAPAWSAARLAEAFVLTGWALGAEAARRVPFAPLLGNAGGRTPAGTTPTAGGPAESTVGLETALRAIAPAMAGDGSAAILLGGDGPRGLVAAGLAGAGAGWRVQAARLGEPGRVPGGLLELVPPGGRLGPGPRTRANRPLAPVPGGAGDPASVMAGGRFGGPAPLAGRFSVSELNRVVTETAVAVLQARGEPAELRHLAGELLAALDRSGQLHRYVAAKPAPGPAPGPVADATADAATDATTADHLTPGPTVGDAALDRAAAAEDLLALVEGELSRGDQRKIAPSEGGRLWLADLRDAAAAAAPLADRLEWAVFSLLGTGASIPEAAVRARLDEMFAGADAPDPWLVDACLASYGVPAPGDARLVARDDLQARSQEHAATIALLADLGHRLGLHVAIAPRERGRRADGAPLAARLLPDELEPGLGFLGRAGAEALEQVDACWYVRPRFAFLFEVEWTAMLGEPVLRRGRAIPADERIVRFLVIPPERVELLRRKLEGYPVLRAGLADGNWHVLRTDALRRFAAREAPSLGQLEPYLGLDPPADRPDQLPLFEG
jgi:hypothetical protein